MKKRLFSTLIIIYIFINIFSVNNAYASSEITLDGYFDDWNDKPYLTDILGDSIPNQDIVKVAWYPDNANNNLYVYCERSNNELSMLSLNIIFKSDSTSRQVIVLYNSQSGTTNVFVYDSQGRYVWSASGNWGDKEQPGTRVEFKIPMSYLINSTIGGYELGMYINSLCDRAPDEGEITISTAGTLPIASSIAGIVIVLFTMNSILKLRKKSNIKLYKLKNL